MFGWTKIASSRLLSWDCPDLMPTLARTRNTWIPILIDWFGPLWYIHTQPVPTNWIFGNEWMKFSPNKRSQFYLLYFFCSCLSTLIQYIYVSANIATGLIVVIVIGTALLHARMRYNKTKFVIIIIPKIPYNSYIFYSLYILLEFIPIH